ncbi:MAG: PKD repeat protein, partial [Cyclobacteriaceae bacterium]
VQGSNFRTLTFAAVCDASEGFSSSFEPTGISYSTAGTKEIWLRALDAQGDASDVDNTVGISEAKVPEIVIQSFDTYCVLSEISFTSENLSTNITTYSWDFDGDQIIDSTDPIPTFQFSAAGTYNPRLDVVAANGCTNFVIDTLTIFPEPPTPSFSALLDDPCVDESVIITNLTDESGYEGLLQYTWEVTDIDSLLTGSSPALSFTTPGQKVISVISSIPGCESIAASDTVTINALPVVDFQGDLACIGTPTTFSNLSEGNQYQWQFGDGFQSTEMLPSHLYDAPGVYDVALFVEDENGCQDTLTQQVAVASIPNPSFQVDLICANEISVLQDQSSVVNADITAWEWLVSDTLFSTAQSPEISFSEAGSYEIEQRIMSSAGCEQSVIRQVQVLSDPIPEISYSRRCLGDEWVFHVGNSASDYITAQWTIEGVMVSSADSLTSIFTEADTVLIGLTLTNSNLCSATTETLVVITAAPLLDFSIDTSCSNEFTTFTNLSSSTADPIIGQEWFVNGISTASSRNFQRQFGQSGSYEIVLEVTTTSGCVYDQMQIIEIVSVPTAAFTASSNYGIEGSIIDFTNASTSAVAYIWLVNGDTISQALDAMYQFTESGNYTVTLVAENADGCYDQTASQVLIAQPSIDLVITSLQLQDGGDGFSNVVVEIANKSNLPVEQLTFQIQLDNGVTLRETIRQMIGINGNNVITLNTEVPMLAQLKSVCLQVSSNYGVADRVPEDNRQCVTFEQDELIFERPYPVPARDYLTIPMILPGNSNVKFELLQLSGQTVIKQNYLTEKKGLTNFRLELGAVEPGMYFLRVSVGGRSEITRVIVQ